MPTASFAASGYSIILASAPGKNLNWNPKNSSLLKKHTVYVQQVTVKGKDWERLCLGYFNSRRDTFPLLKKLKKIYPGAWVQKSSSKDRTYIIKKASTTNSGQSKTSTLPNKQLNSLMKRAKTDFKAKKYNSAIRYLKALNSAGTHKYSQESLELLGLARHRKGQDAHAVSTYEKYLKQYPDGDGSDRVRQRLAGLLTARKGPRSEMTMSTFGESGVDEFDTYGSISQFYRTNRAKTDDIGAFTSLSQLISFFDVTTQQRTNKFDHRYQFTADHTYDFLDSEKNSEVRFIETYYELSYRRNGSSGRFGRQALRIGGILKRFDGISAGYQITPDMRINALAGLPVDVNNKSSFNKNKSFYGFIFETGTFLENWDVNLFYFIQEFDGLKDRDSVGTEVRYRDNRKSLFGMVDYDLFYKSINILQLNANMLFDRGRSAYLNAFMRKSPILATSNALIGRQEKTIDELKKTLNIEQIYQLARDRTANSQTITVGGTQPINEKFQATADVTLSRVGDTVESGGIARTDGTGTDYFFSTQIVGNSLLVKRDTGVLGIRYYDTHPSNTISFIANSRFPISKKWRINPRLQYDIRTLSNGRKQKKLRAIFRTDYRYLNKARFDFEIGYDDVDESGTTQSLGSSNLFLTLGYRWDF